MSRRMHGVFLTLEFPAGLAPGEGGEFNVLRLARNGAGQPVLRGTALAGALWHAYWQHLREMDEAERLAQVRAYFGEALNEESPESGEESRFKVSDCVLTAAPLTRTHHLRNRHTGAVADAGLFTLELCPRGTTAPVTLWLTDDQPEPDDAVQFLKVLVQCLQSGITLGGHAARGIGLATLQGQAQYRCYELSQVEDYAQWLDDRRASRQDPAAMPTGCEPLHIAADQPANDLRITFRLGIPRGQDVLIGDGQGKSHDIEPQRVVAADGKSYWRLPGASLRGLFRGWVTRLAARDGKPVADYAQRQLYQGETLPDHERWNGNNLGWGFVPEDERKPGNEPNCPVLNLFGSLYRAGRIHISDAYAPCSTDAEGGTPAEEQLRIVKVSIPGQAEAPPPAVASQAAQKSQQARGGSSQPTALKSLPKASAHVLGLPFHNPYTFLPFPDKAPHRRQATLLSADELGGERERLTGVLELAITTETPLLSCHPREVSDKGGHKTYAALAIGPDVIVPATGVRGALRTLMTILTGGTLGYLDEYAYLCQGRDTPLGPQGPNSPPLTPKHVFLAEVEQPGTALKTGAVRLGKTQLVKLEDLERANQGRRLDRGERAPVLWIGLDDHGQPVTDISLQQTEATPWKLKLSGRPINLRGKREGAFLPGPQRLELPPELWAAYSGRNVHGDRRELKAGDLVWLEPSDPSLRQITYPEDVKSLQWARWGKTGQALKDKIPGHILPDYENPDCKVDEITDLFGQVAPKRNDAPAFAARIRPENLVFFDAAAKAKKNAVTLQMPDWDIRSAGDTLHIDGWEREVHDLDLRVRMWTASQKPVPNLRYPRAVDDNRNRKSRGGHAWFQRHASPRMVTNRGDGSRQPGLNPLHIDGEIKQAAEDAKQPLDPVMPMIAGQMLPPFDPEDPLADVLYGYDAVNAEIQDRQRPRRRVFLRVEAFDPEQHVTGVEQSGGNQGKNAEFRKSQRQTRETD
ncbi:RAMP superfamily CRISPR-associated protein [Candidatus Entotheonella palauensis]|uniref:CRISPR type III-associated protein domain-containing protein n=1 Tax=Candidatus Entotheonella gemina TaxID=1429439 RepID=W4M9F1_9BACT|nr:RAMP superfamily CRISPR-associated protein [Candidatus Entotheonella palauensis]ETX06257.1 MAG: hypothetical protein ETSY2_18230 [Candidatus Entotheonella gemina]